MSQEEVKKEKTEEIQAPKKIKFHLFILNPHL